MDIQHTFFVNRPMSDVFGYFADIENVPNWADNIRVERFTTEGGPRNSALFHEDARVFGFPYRSDWVMEEFDPPSTFSVRSESRTGVITCRYQFAETQDGTRVDWTYRFGFRGPAKLARLLIPGVILRLHQGQFEVAKHNLEVAE